MDKDARSMAWYPGRVGKLGPLDAILGIPDVVSIGLIPAFENPQLVVKNGHLMHLAFRPRGFREMLLPVYTVWRTPDVIVKRPLGPRGIVKSAAQNPDPILKDGLSTNQRASRPDRPFRLDLFPINAIGGGPDVADRNGGEQE